MPILELPEADSGSERVVKVSQREQSLTPSYMCCCSRIQAWMLSACAQVAQRHAQGTGAALAPATQQQSLSAASETAAGVPVFCSWE